MYRERLDLTVQEERRIIIDLLPVVKGRDGRLRLADERAIRCHARTGLTCRTIGKPNRGNHLCFAISRTHQVRRFDLLP